MFKAGDKVRILNIEDCGRHPTEKRYLMVGDIVAIEKIDHNVIEYMTYDGLANWLSIENVELVEESPKVIIDCTCESQKLTWYGCQCGYLKARREAGLE